MGQSGTRLAQDREAEPSERVGGLINPLGDRNISAMKRSSQGRMVITIITAIVHQHATKDSQELLISRLGILGEGFNVFSYYLSPSCQVNCVPALICKTKRPGY